MTIEITHTPPNPSSYVELATFQSATPDTFTRPVLHSLQKNCTIRTSGEQAKLLPTLSSAIRDGQALDQDITIEGIDIWVTSE